MPSLSSAYGAIGVLLKAVVLVALSLLASALLTIFVTVCIYALSFILTLSIDKAGDVAQGILLNIVTISLLMVCCYAVIVGIVVAFTGLIDRKKVTLDELGMGRRKDAVKLFVAGLAVFAAFMAMSFIIESALGALGLLAGQGAHSMISSPGYSAFRLALSTLAVLFMTLAVAFGEEILYRGYIQKALTARYGLAAGLLLAALIFMASHALNSTDVFYFADIFMAGLVFGYLYHLTGSIWITIGYHFLQDFVAIQVLAAQNGMIHAYPFFTVATPTAAVAFGLTVEQAGEIMDVFALALILAALWLYGKSRSKAKGERASPAIP